MLAGILGAIFWGLETVLLGIALSSGLAAQAEVLSSGSTGLVGVMLAPLAAACLHDACSSIYTAVYHGFKSSLPKVWRAVKTRSGRNIALAALIGGPVGMTGYILSVSCLGPAIGAVASTIYPAVGAALAFFFLKENMAWYRWIFLALTLFCVYALSFSGEIAVTDFVLGIAGTLMCAFGWGGEGVIIAKSGKDPQMESVAQGADASAIALQIRQTVSALAYALVLLPLIGGTSLAGWKLVIHTVKTPVTFGFIALAALAATTSYLFYYRALRKIGAIRAMVLNVTYCVWAMVFAFLLLKDRAILSPGTLLCTAGVLAFSLLAAGGTGKAKGRSSP